MALIALVAFLGLFLIGALFAVGMVGMVFFTAISGVELSRRHSGKAIHALGLALLCGGCILLSGHAWRANGWEMLGG